MLSYPLPLGGFLAIMNVRHVSFKCVYMHINFTFVTKIETRYEVLPLNVELSMVQL